MPGQRISLAVGLGLQVYTGFTEIQAIFVHRRPSLLCREHLGQLDKAARQGVDLGHGLSGVELLGHGSGHPPGC